MPEYVLNRTHALASIHGRVINFEKNVPVWVPPECEKEALQIGAEPVDGPKDILPPEKEEAPVLSGEERKAKIFDAFKLLESRHERGDFTAQGVPANKALDRILGFNIENKERDAMWREYKTGETE